MKHLKGWSVDWRLPEIDVDGFLEVGNALRLRGVMESRVDKTAKTFVLIVAPYVLAKSGHGDGLEDLIAAEGQARTSGHAEWADDDNKDDTQEESDSSSTNVISVFCDGEQAAGIKQWAMVQDARRLLCENVEVGVLGVVSIVDGKAMLMAHSLRLLSALPDPCYIVRLLKVFHGISKPRKRKPPPTNKLAGRDLLQGEVGLTALLRPSTLMHCRDLLKMVTDAYAGGDTGDTILVDLGNDATKAVAISPQTLFKSKLVTSLQRDMLQVQGWQRAKSERWSRVRPEEWEAVIRFEARWHEKKYDGQEGRASRFVGGQGWREWDLGCVDPVRNLAPSLLTNKRRVRYAAEKKRPQICCMLDRLHHLVAHCMRNRTCSSSPVHVVDIGGGRGDLGLAVATCFAKCFAEGAVGVDGGVNGAGGRVHVTVVDNNTTALTEGKRRAEEAGVCNIDFVEVSPLAPPLPSLLHSPRSFTPPFASSLPSG
jgi:hypothetical protein